MLFMNSLWIVLYGNIMLTGFCFKIVKMFGES